jgi:hypothetical protein
VTPVRTVLPGATRTCPHCRTTVLERAVRCPQCQKHLRHDPDANRKVPASVSPFRVEGTIRPPDGETWEYDLLLIIRDAAGREVSRKLVDVGALVPGDARTFTLSVEVMAPRGIR